MSYPAWTSRPVADLALVHPDPDADTAGMIIYGAPMHDRPAAVARRLARDGLEHFLCHEARHSVGNYALVWHEGRRSTIVTAPGYCGGYIRTGQDRIAVATHMTRALSLTPDPVEIDPGRFCYYLAHAPYSSFSTLPFGTPFRDLDRLPPGSVLVLEGGQIQRFEGYLNHPDRLPPPESFATALDEVATAIARDTARRPQRDITVMFSGGVDCLAIYLAMRKVFDPERIRLVTMEHNRSNGPERSLPVARALGKPVEIIPGTATDAPQVQQAMLDWLAVDMAGAFHPHRALVGRRNTLILHGQNMDALVNGHMTVLQEFQGTGYFSRSAGKILTNDGRTMRRDRAFTKNLAFTDAYLTDLEFQHQSAPHMATTFEGSIPDPQPGLDGVLRGLISYQMPNILSDIELPVPQTALLDAEIVSFRRWLGTGSSTPRMQADIMRFLSYSAVVAKRFQGYPIGPGSELSLPANSGPLLSYYIGRSRGLADANNPKREVFAYAHDATGKRYKAMTRSIPQDGLDWTPAPGRTIGRTKAFAAAVAALTPEAVSSLIAGSDASTVQPWLDLLLAGLHGSSEPRLADGKLGGLDKPRLVRLANLLWIRQTAENLRSTKP